MKSSIDNSQLFLQDPLTGAAEFGETGLLESFDINGRVIQVYTKGTEIHRKLLSVDITKVHHETLKVIK